MTRTKDFKISTEWVNTSKFLLFFLNEKHLLTLKVNSFINFLIVHVISNIFYLYNYVFFIVVFDLYAEGDFSSFQ